MVTELQRRHLMEPIVAVSIAHMDVVEQATFARKTQTELIVPVKQVSLVAVELAPSKKWIPLVLTALAVLPNMDVVAVHK